MSPDDKREHHDRDAEPSPSARPGSERYRDEQREERGPVYHGKDWKDADDEPDREALRIPAEEEVKSDAQLADEELTEPGRRGANLGRGGRGLVERDDGEVDGDEPVRK